MIIQVDVQPRTTWAEERALLRSGHRPKVGRVVRALTQGPRSEREWPLVPPLLSALISEIGIQA